jgi:Tol biopolymer transport system component
VRLQLERIVQSEIFVKSTRLTAFLRYVVEETLAGQKDKLKEQVLALELYGRSSDFDSSLDSIVRVDARRLRDRLREYYAESTGDPVIISLPKGAYVPIFERGNTLSAVVKLPSASPPEADKPSSHARWRRRIVYSGTGVVVAAILLLYYLRPPSTPAPAVRPLASLTGEKGPPTLSPDGNFAAFFWSGAPEKPEPGVYIASVDGTALRRLTSGSGPAWSPDGREIAFVRDGPDNPGVFVISQLGGAEWKVSNSGTNVAWTPNAKALLVRDRESPAEPYAIFSIALDTLQKRRLTRPPIPLGDWRFAVSPNGETLAFIRFGIPGLGDIYLLPIAGGEPRRITSVDGELNGLAWTPDGRDIIYDLDESGGSRLWRISAGESSPGRGIRVAEATSDALAPVIVRSGAGGRVRLAYLVRRQQVGIRMIELTAQSAVGAISAAKWFQRSSRFDQGARVSPDGERVAFFSNRDGTQELWVSGVDGSNLHRLTHLGRGNACFAAWSPDGQKIAFNSGHGTGNIGVKAIWVVPAGGGEPRRLTIESDLVGPPHWSGDSQWIYFYSRRSGSPQIWKITSSAEQPVEITRNGGFDAQESPDGKHLYYTDWPSAADPYGLQAPSRLKRVPVNGGEEIVVLPRISNFNWSVTVKGIYYVVPGPTSIYFLMRYDYDTGRSERLGDLPARLVGDVAVSRGGQWLSFSQADRVETDLMLIDNFR